jgi:hypothetical protein
LWCAAGIALAFAAALWDRALAGANASHLGGALGSSGTGGYTLLAEIAWRKILMNLRISTHPATLTAITSVLLIGVLANTALRDRKIALIANHPEWARGLPAAGWGAISAFLFNDSGVVAALLLIGAFLMSGLYFNLAGGSGPAITPDVPTET